MSLAEIDGAPTITRSALDVTAIVPDLDPDVFDDVVAEAAVLCPVSRLFAGAEVTVSAKLVDA